MASRSATATSSDWAGSRLLKARRASTPLSVVAWVANFPLSRCHAYSLRGNGGNILNTGKGRTMRYKLLGRTGLRVSEVCLGTMTFGEDWGWGASKDESRRILDHYLDAGGNFVDTANLYTNGTSETFLGEFLQGRRDRVVLATKYTNAMPGNDPNAAGNHRKSMAQALDLSLRRLKSDYLDLYWLHIWDFLTPIDEVMRAFDDFVRAGK